jgi:hypothetical protein
MRHIGKMIFLSWVSCVGAIGCLAVLIAGGAGAVAAESTVVTLQINGAGKVKPDVSGKTFIIGSWLTLRPIPEPGWVFAGWDNYECPACNAFKVEAGLKLEAHFIPSPFPALKGSYAGLICETTNRVSHNRAGAISLKMNENGLVKGEIWFAGRRYKIEDLGDDTVESKNGQVTAWIHRFMFFKGDLMKGSLRQVLTAQIVNDLDNPGAFSGTVSDAHIEKGVEYPASFLASIQGGRANGGSGSRIATHTVVFRPLGYSGGSPANGFGRVNVKTDGSLNFAGVLPGNRLAVQKTLVLVSGDWPLYSALDRGNGSLIGWCNLREAEGKASWLGLPGGAATDQEMSVASSEYSPPVGSKWPLQLTNALLVLSGPGFASDLRWRCSFSGNGKVVYAGPGRLALTFSKTTGYFSGSLTQPGATAKYIFRGAVLQNVNAGYGYYTDPAGQTGSVVLLPDL